MIAIITTDKNVYDNFRMEHNIDARHSRQICRKSDLDGTVFDMVYDLDPLSNVTDWVREKIKVKNLENN
jgi:hypothetical protein